VSVLKPVLADLFRARWGKTPSDADLVLLLKKRPNVTVAEWAAVLEEYAAEDERGYMPRPSSLLMRLPVERRVCELCNSSDGRGGVRVRGALADPMDARRAGLDDRDFKRVVGGEVHVTLAGARQLEAHGYKIKWIQFLAGCDKCAKDCITIGDCFRQGGRLCGFVEVAGFGPDGGPPERQAAVELVVRVLQWAAGQGCEPGYTDRLTAREWLDEVRAGRAVREELREVLDGAVTLQDVAAMERKTHGTSERPDADPV
jgi:hypothetical protein